MSTSGGSEEISSSSNSSEASVRIESFPPPFPPEHRLDREVGACHIVVVPTGSDAICRLARQLALMLEAGRRLNITVHIKVLFTHAALRFVKEDRQIQVALRALINQVDFYPPDACWEPWCKTATGEMNYRELADERFSKYPDYVFVMPATGVCVERLARSRGESLGIIVAELALSRCLGGVYIFPAMDPLRYFNHNNDKYRRKAREQGYKVVEGQNGAMPTSEELVAFYEERLREWRFRYNEFGADICKSIRLLQSKSDRREFTADEIIDSMVEIGWKRRELVIEHFNDEIRAQRQARRIAKRRGRDVYYLR